MAVERLRAAVAELAGRQELPVTISIGTATWDRPPPSVEDLVRAADTLMYEAKSAGQDRVRQVTVGAGPPANETGETP